jgi:uroporphyrinogen-III synthase
MTYNELKPKLIITRPVDSANLFASFFERNLQKEQIIISPAIEIKFFSRPKILKKTPNLIFTSSNGVKAAGQATNNNIRAICVGDRTTSLASSLGYSAEKYGDNVEQLIKKLRISKKIEGDILHVRGKYTKIDLVNRLREAGFLCYEWEGYDQLAKDLSFQALNAFENSEKIILPIFSERSGRLLKDQIPKFDRCHIIAISSAVANVFLDARPASISEAQTPDLVGMRSSTKTVLKNALLE